MPRIFNNNKRKRREMIKKTFAVALVALGLTFGVTTSANAKDAEVARAAAVVAPNSVNTAAIQVGAVDTFRVKDKSMGSWDILDNTITWMNLGSDIRRNINTQINAATAAKSTADKALAKANEALAAPDAGVSTLKAAFNSDAQTPQIIENAGGSWLTRNTKLGEITVPAGKWTIHCKVKFTRIDVPTAGTVSRPQFAIRLNASESSFGQDMGTVGGNDISPVKDGDLFGQCESQPLTFAGPETLTVHAFDYQDNRGSDDGGKIVVANALVWLTAA